MKLEMIVQRVESRLFDLGRVLLQADEKSSLREELELAEGELESRQAELKRVEARRDELTQQVRALELQAVELPGQVESSFRRGKSSQALRQALELERARRDLAAARAELPGVEQMAWSLDFHLRQLRRRLDRVREQLGAK